MAFVKMPVALISQLLLSAFLLKKIFEHSMSIITYTYIKKYFVPICYFVKFKIVFKVHLNISDLLAVSCAQRECDSVLEIFAHFDQFFSKLDLFWAIIVR
jgi:hypothetical protein